MDSKPPKDIKDTWGPWKDVRSEREGEDSNLMSHLGNPSVYPCSPSRWTIHWTT